MFRQDFDKTYSMVSPCERRLIIQKINEGLLESETAVGKKQKWWTRKHHPDSEIPKNIYLLGSGTIGELHIEYIKHYGSIEWSEFIDHTRELLKQNIMI
jgi:hypothetical protein